MVRSLSVFALLLAGLAGPLAVAQPDAVPLRVMSYNVRLNTAADSLDAWPHRREAVAGLLRFYGPDLVGLQEPQGNQLDDLAQALPGYAWFGQPRADGGARDEYSPIFYRTDRLDLLVHDTFWLSETPDVPAVRGWDAAFPRIVTWGRFRDRVSGDTLYLFNTHFDHVGEQARAESARLLRRQIDAIAGDAPVVVTGDFNATPASEPIQVMQSSGLADAREISADPPYGPASTWNGFEAIVPGRRIDYVFVSDGVAVRRHGTLAETYDSERFPSDHLPVLVDIVVE